MTRPATDITRRRLLRATAGATALTGAAGVVTAQEGQRHTVDMTDALVFDPDAITVAPGDTIVWENVGNIGHSVTAYEDDIPADAEYFASGGFDSEDAARSGYAVGDPDSGDIAGGESFEHTFEVEGSYGYFCVPHESAGMVASVEVAAGGGGNGGGDGDGGNGGPVVPDVPDVAKTLAVAATGTLLAVVGLAYLFLKYGGDYVTTDGEDDPG
jgi:plastocyanin